MSEAGDIITDFSAPSDDIWIKGSAFGGNLGSGFLAAGRFTSGTDNKADDAGDRFIYNTNTDNLYYDRDGPGTQFGAVLIANCDTSFDVTAAGIFIF